MPPLISPVILTLSMLLQALPDACNARASVNCSFEAAGDCSVWNIPHNLPSLLDVINSKNFTVPPSNQNAVGLSVKENDGGILLVRCPPTRSTPIIVESILLNSTLSDCVLTFDLLILNHDLLDSFEIVLRKPNIDRDQIFWSSADEPKTAVNKWQRYLLALGTMTERHQLILEITCATVFQNVSRAKELDLRPVLALDNLNFNQCFAEPMRNNTCSEAQFACVSLQSCLDSDAVCDYVNDCPNASDEASICDAFPQGSRCSFESDFCGWFQSDSKKSFVTWERQQAGKSAIVGFAGYESIVDHSTGSRNGHFLSLHFQESDHKEAVAEFRSPLFPAYYQGFNNTGVICKIRFYYMAVGIMDNGIFLTVNFGKSSAVPHEILWKYRSRTSGQIWTRASIPLRNMRSKYFFQFWGMPGHRSGTFLIDDISLSWPCFFQGIKNEVLDKFGNDAELNGLPNNENDEDTLDIDFETSFTITTCGRIGPYGPAHSDCAEHYSSLNQAIDMIQLNFVLDMDLSRETIGVQRWRVPFTSIYNISAVGAHGGDRNVSANCPISIASALINLKAGDEVLFIVGQKGESCFQAKTAVDQMFTRSHSSMCKAGGGGGGTFVFKFNEKTRNAVPLIVAGGEGGGSSPGIGGNTCVLRVSTLPSGQTNSVVNPPGYGLGFLDVLGGKHAGNDPSLKRERNATGKRYCTAEKGLMTAGGGYGGGGAGCGPFGGGGGGYEGGEGGTKPTTPGTSAVNTEYAVSSRFWLSSDSLGGRVTITVICNCSISCRVRKDTSELYCPDSIDDGDISWSEQNSLVVLIVMAIGIFAGAIVGTALCLYFGLRKNSAKCIHRESGIWSCASGTPETNANPLLLQRLDNHGNIELNQLYGISGVNGYNDLVEIQKRRIHLKHSIGQGAFGVVYQGIMNSDTGDVPVAIKTLPAANSTQEAETDFAAEALIISRFHHPNIVHCFGVSFAQNPKYIVLELLAGGDVRTFLRSVRHSKASTVTMIELLEISADIAKGCQYLEQHHFIHRDIAARNCLLTTIDRNRVAKVADFGMARDVIRSEYYRRNTRVLLPVKWMPPEALQEGVFSSKSDIWAFGVFLWEILSSAGPAELEEGQKLPMVFSLGCAPYASMTNGEVIGYVLSGGRLNLPSSHCPVEIYDLMQDCWHKTPADRKSFSSIIRSLLGFMGLTSVVIASVPDANALPLPLQDIILLQPPTADTAACFSSGCSQDRASTSLDCNSGTKLLRESPSN